MTLFLEFSGALFDTSPGFSGDAKLMSCFINERMVDFLQTEVVQPKWLRIDIYNGYLPGCIQTVHAHARTQTQ